MQLCHARSPPSTLSDLSCIDRITIPHVYMRVILGESSVILPCTRFTKGAGS